MQESGVLRQLRSEWMTDEESVLRECEAATRLTIGMGEANSLFLMLGTGMGIAVVTVVLELALGSVAKNLKKTKENKWR